MDATLRLDTSPFSQIDRRFFAVLLGSMLIHAIAATWVARQPHIAASETYDSAPVDRFLKAPLLPIPKTFPPVKMAQPPKAGPPQKNSGPPRNSGGGTPALPGLLAGAIGELTKDSGDPKAALDGARHGNVDTTLLAVRREGTNQAEGIGPITTKTVGPVGTFEHRDAPTAPPPPLDPIEIDDPQPDVDVFIRYINQHRSSLAACYERELKLNHGLKGRVMVRFTISEQGRAQDIAVDDGSLKSPAVSDCIRSAVRRWIFPVKPQDEVPLQFPVLFTPAA